MSHNPASYWGQTCVGCDRYYTVAEIEASRRPWVQCPDGTVRCPRCTPQPRRSTTTVDDYARRPVPDGPDPGKAVEKDRRGRS